MPRRITPGGPFFVSPRPLDSPPNNVGPQGARGPRTIVLPAPKRWLVLWPEEELAPAAAASTLEEDTFVPGLRAGMFPPAQPVLVERAEEWIASLPVDDDYSYIGPYRGFAPAKVFTGDDDAWMASIGVDEDAPAVVRAAAQILARLVFFDDDGLPVQAAPFGLDEDGWQSPVFVFGPAPRPFVGDEEWAPTIPVDDDYSYIGPYRGFPRVPVFTADDDAWMASICVDDDAPAVVRAAAQVLARLVFLDDDGLPVQAAPFGLDEDGWQSPVFVFGPAPRPFVGDEEWAPTIPIDEDWSWISVPLASWRPPLPERFIVGHETEDSSFAPGVFTADSPLHFRIGLKTVRLGQTNETPGGDRLGSSAITPAAGRLGEENT